MNKLLLISMLLLVCSSSVSAVRFVEANKNYFGDTAETGNIVSYFTLRGWTNMVLLAQNGDHVYFNGKVRDEWPDPTAQYMIQGGANTWTNMPLAVTEMAGSYRIIGDFSNKDEVRFGTNLALAGSANSKIYVQYSLAGINWFNISKTDEFIAVNSTGPKVTGWDDLPIPTRNGDIILRVVGVGGDGIVDPQFRGVWVEVR